MLGERLPGVSVSQRDIAWSNESGRNVLAEFLEYDRGRRFVGEYMTKVDGATMFHSLEARSPFLDQDLWEFASSLSFELRLHGGVRSRYCARSRQKRLGERVSRGRKRGFTIPVGRWLVGRWRNALTELLQTSILDREGWINSRATLDRFAAAAERVRRRISSGTSSCSNRGCGTNRVPASNPSLKCSTRKEQPSSDDGSWTRSDAASQQKPPTVVGG